MPHLRERGSKSESVLLYLQPLQNKLLKANSFFAHAKERQWKPGLMLWGCECVGSTKQTVLSSAFLPLLYKGMQIGEICWLLWANPLHGFRLLENHSRTENKQPGQSPCLNYTWCWFISCPEYVIECLMDSLFISELTLLNTYITNSKHMFSIYERESY